jgi:EAL domain-containing protein (putative c-di-GMP-specific phosphodiesterase class I)
MELLRDLGCDVVQGFYFGKPLLANEVTAFPHRMQMH